jgi:hypothetical protein
MPWFSDRAGPPSNSHNAAGRVAFHQGDGVGTLNWMISRLNIPAYTCPCQRFAAALTNTDA